MAGAAASRTGRSPRCGMTSYGFEDEPYTLAQLEAIQQALAAIEAEGIDVPIRMASSSAIVLGHPEADLNAVDPGRLVVGMSFQSVAERRRAGGPRWWD
ncbi:alanine racemase [Ancylobacter sp. G4_0304]|uniref:alanine racemase n=1 Tax=Ancylobacter sp. G4_0304 TaxID=3114289 RepID=UPI0039C63B1C